MKAEWYYTQGGQQLGPFTAADMKKFAEDGKLKQDDLVWKEGMANWVAAKAVKGIFPAAPPLPVSRPAGVEPAGGIVAGGPADDFAYDAPSPRVKPAGKRQAEDDHDDEEEVQADFDDRPSSPRREPGGVVAYLTFQKMIVPIVIQVIFWLGVLGVFGAAAFQLIGAIAIGRMESLLLGALGAFVTVLFGLLFVRIYCELLIVSFRILSTLVEIKELLQKRP